MQLPLILVASCLALSACGSNTDAPATAAGNDVAAQAVADVDAAMAETRGAEPALATTAK